MVTCMVRQTDRQTDRQTGRLTYKVSLIQEGALYRYGYKYGSSIVLFPSEYEENTSSNPSLLDKNIIIYVLVLKQGRIVHRSG